MEASNRNLPPLTVFTTTTVPSTRHRSTRPPQGAAPVQLWSAPPGEISTTATQTPRSSPIDNKSILQPPSLVSIQNHSQPQQQLHHDGGVEYELHDPPVDAALLAALSDPRERVSLLRLERSLVDFATDSSLTQVEVGVGAVSTSGETSNFVSSGTPASVVDETTGNPPPPSLNSINRVLQNMNLRTSFHRKCLHKLADRFRITREVGENNTIRLVKGKDSKVPNKLLIDLDLAEESGIRIIGGNSGNSGHHMNAPNSIVSGKRSVLGVGVSGRAVSPVSAAIPSSQIPQDRISDNNEFVSSLPVRIVTEGMGNVHLSNGGVAGGGGGKRNKKKEKIKIIKRSVSNKGSSGSLNGKDSNGGYSASRRKKNLSDKEKAYAEARARIFNSSAENMNARKNNFTSVQANNADESSIQGNSNNTVSSSTTTDNLECDAACNIVVARKSSPSNSAVSGDFAGERSQSSSPVPNATLPPLSYVSSPDTTTVTTPLPSSSTNYSSNVIESSVLEPMGKGTAVSTNATYNNNVQNVVYTKANSNVAAAVTSGAMSKVTWRNRQQDTSDPDFQRGVHVVGGLGVPMTAVSSPNTSYHSVSVNHQYHGSHHHLPPPPSHESAMLSNAGVLGQEQHHIMNGYHYAGAGVNGAGDDDNGGVMVDLGGYHHPDSASWQRQDSAIGGGGNVSSAESAQKPHQVPPVIYSNSNPSSHHHQYRVLSRQQQYSYSGSMSSVQMGSGSGNMSLTARQQRHIPASSLRDGGTGEGNSSRLVYSAEDFPALG